jgi:hypothetical protein
MKDTTSKIQLERTSKKRPEKRRKTQSSSFFQNASGVSLKPVMYSFGNVKVAAGSVSISYDQANPSNTVNNKSIDTLGNDKDTTFTSFDDTKKDINKSPDFLKENREKTFKESTLLKSSGVCDVTRRNFFVTNQSQNKNSIIKGSVGSNIDRTGSTSALIASSFEGYSTNDAFFDEHSNVRSDNTFYINSKNYYNSGESQPFSEKSNVKNNSIIKSRDSDNKYYKSHKQYANHGFLYKSKLPDSIAFGGLKR